MFNRKTYHILLCFLIVSCLAQQASAGMLTITSMPVQTAGDLPHTTFHSSDNGDGTGGTILGWANLSPDAVSTYDPVTGALDLNLKIYGSSETADKNMSPIGDAHGVSSNLFGSGFTNPETLHTGTGEVIGTITWTFDFFVYLEFFDAIPDPIPTVTMQFVDFNYVTTDDGFTANTWDGTNLILWGADGDYLGGDAGDHSKDGKFDVSTTTIGFDFAGVTTGSMVVPEPSSLVLLLTGMSCLGGVGFWRKRRRRGTPEQV